MEKNMRATSSISYDANLPAHDIFCTPENESFHSTKPYTKLDADRQEIRLIKVLPDDGSGLIKCMLLQNTPLLHVQGKYTALSYCAGDPKRIDTILVNGSRCNVFANLRHALVEARHFWEKSYNDRELLLWIDQISINQIDVRERSHQVRFMREIYQLAEQVLVCLSTTRGTPKGMEWLLGLVEDVPPREDDLLLKEDQYRCINGSEGDESEYEPSIDRYHWHRLEHHIWGNVVSEKFARGWLAFYDIVESPWWNRAWVVQEFIVASEVHFLYRRRFASWEDLRPILKSLCSIHRYSLTNRNLFLELNDQYLLNGREDLNLCRIIDRIKRGGSQAAMDTVEFMVESKISWSKKMELKDLLVHSRYFSTSNPRDKVYAFIGLGDPGYQIVPNYSHSISQVLVETTRRIIEHEDSLDILSHAAASRKPQNSTLPSWVVDWTQRELSNDRNNHIGKKFSYLLWPLHRSNADAPFPTIMNSQSLPSCPSLEV